jgi:Phasin protein
VSHQFKRGGAGNAGQIPNIPLPPGFALMTWNPFLTGDAEALGGFGTIAREWHNFVGRRLKEDVALVQRLARCSRPDQVLSAYTDFWRRAGEDYGKEITTMTDLMTDIAGKMAVATQSATDQASARLFQREAA